MNCYFCSSLPVPSALATVEAAEARHAATSRRQKVGEQVALVDGKGGRALATIVALDRHSMSLRIDAVERVERPRPDIVLATALAKGDRQATLLDMAAQMGIFRYVPLICERSSVKPDARHAARWQRIFTQACKQSHNPYLPDIGDARSPGELASALADRDTDLYIATPEGEPLPAGARARRAGLFIGPEGGFTGGETSELLAAGARPLSLGDNVLRIETAAIAAVAVTRSRYERIEPTREEQQP